MRTPSASFVRLAAVLALFHFFLASSVHASAAAHEHDYAAQQVLPNSNSNSNDAEAQTLIAMASGKMAASSAAAAPHGLNVLKKPLALHSLSPLTGYTRNGYCAAPASDSGNHSVAGIVTDEFLDYSAARGNDLRVVPGMRAGCKWCLCAGRWLEAFRERHTLGHEVVPRVVLEATGERALERVRLDELKAFAVDAEGKRVGGFE